MAKTTIESPTLRELYPDLAEEDLASAAEVLDRYIDLVARITERLVSDPEALVRHRRLTHTQGISTMTGTSTNASDQ